MKGSFDPLKGPDPSQVGDMAYRTTDKGDSFIAVSRSPFSTDILIFPMRASVIQ